MTTEPCTIAFYRHRHRRRPRWPQVSGSIMHADGNQRDLDLVAAYLSNPDYAAALVERLQIVPRLVAIRNARFGRPLDSHELDDLSQDVLILVLQKLPSYRGHGSLDAFCYRIADLELRNRVRSQWRSRRTVGELGDRDPATSPPFESDERVLDALDRLGGAEAEAIRWRLFEGLDFNEIAARTETTAVNAKTRYYRGLARLQASLKSMREEGPHAT